MNKDKTKNREQIIHEYIEWYLDGTSRADLEEVVATQMWDDLGMLGDAELVNDIRQFAPHIVENITLSI